MLNQITIHNWKKFETSIAKLPDHSFIMTGQNGSGKTSLLSAIYSVNAGKSWPETKFTEFLQTDKEYFGLTVENSDWYLSGKKGLNGRVFTKFQKPEDLVLPNIFTYQPTFNYWLSLSRSQKLKILDNLIGQVYGQMYLQATDAYSKAIKGKQNLITQIENGEVQTDWLILERINVQILEYSRVIWKYRKAFFENIVSKLELFQEFIESPASNLELRLEYSNLSGRRTTLFDPWDVELTVEHLNALWTKEIAAGQILFGSHRDNFSFEINNTPIETYLSSGELRLFVFFIIQCAVQSFKSFDSNQLKPVWLLADDIFNELDEKREQIILKQVLANVDKFIATSAKEIGEISLDIGEIIYL